VSNLPASFIVAARSSGEAPITAETMDQLFGTPLPVQEVSAPPEAQFFRADGVLRWGAHTLKVALEKARPEGRLPGHVRRHVPGAARQAVGRSVFRKSFDVRKSLIASLEEAHKLVLSRGDDLYAGRAVRSGRVEVRVRSGMADRLEITVDFGKSVGQAGERLARIVVSKVGNVITFFPIRTAAAGTFLGISGLSAGDANALYARYDARVAQTATQMTTSQRDPEAGWSNDLLGVLDPTGILFAEPANAAEGSHLTLWRGALLALADVEKVLKRKLSANERHDFMSGFAGAVESTLVARGH
jgi:hypothetical protein